MKVEEQFEIFTHCFLQIFSQLLKSASTKYSLSKCGWSHAAQDSMLLLLYLLALNTNFNFLFVYCVFRGNLKADHLPMNVLQTA